MCFISLYTASLRCKWLERDIRILTKASLQYSPPFTTTAFGNGYNSDIHMAKANLGSWAYKYPSLLPEPLPSSISTTTSLYYNLPLLQLLPTTSTTPLPPLHLSVSQHTPETMGEREKPLIKLIKVCASRFSSYPRAKVITAATNS